MTAVDVHADEMRRTWDYWSQAYDTGGGIGFASPAMEAAWLADASRLFGHPAADGTPPLRILDLACGTGQLTLTLARLGHQVSAVDLSPAMLRRAGAKAGQLGLPVAFVRGEVHALPFPDGAFDVVVSKMLLWTLYEPELAMAEWSRVVADGGRVVGIDAIWFGRQATLEHLAWPAYLCRVGALRARDRWRLRHGSFPAPPPPSARKPPGRRWTGTDEVRALFACSGDLSPTLAWLTAVDHQMRLDHGPVHRQIRRTKPFFAVAAVPRRPGT